jgi:hypothetical protein
MTTATRRPAIVIEDQQVAAYMYLWSSWRPMSGQGSRGAYNGRDSVPIEWTYVDHDDVHPVLRGQS